MEGFVAPRILCSLGLLAAALAGGGLCAAGAPPLAAGATREAVIEAYGAPLSESRLGPREVLRYAHGLVIVENGRVVRTEFQGKSVPPARPAAAGPAGRREPEARTGGGWNSDAEAAGAEAGRLGLPMLVWFAGSDWSPASRQFRDEVALQGEFVAAFRSRYVLVRVELSDQEPGKELAANSRLRERLGVTVYPTLMVLSSGGENLARIDLTRAAGETYAGRVIAAVREMHDLLGLAPLPAPAPPAPTPAVKAERPVPALERVAGGLLSGGWQTVSALGTGVAVATGLFWLVWRRRRVRPAPPRRSFSERIAERANEEPTWPEILEWPRHRVAGLATGIAESEGFLTEPIPADDSCDLRLRRAGESDTRGLVRCVDGQSGMVTARQIRGLHAHMAVEAVGFGWFVSPAGFSEEARAFAEANTIRLTDGPRLVAQVREAKPAECRVERPAVRVR